MTNEKFKFVWKDIEFKMSASWYNHHPNCNRWFYYLIIGLNNKTRLVQPVEIKDITQEQFIQSVEHLTEQYYKLINGEGLFNMSVRLDHLNNTHLYLTHINE